MRFIDAMSKCSMRRNILRINLIKQKRKKVKKHETNNKSKYKNKSQNRNKKIKRRKHIINNSYFMDCIYSKTKK